MEGLADSTMNLCQKFGIRLPCFFEGCISMYRSEGLDCSDFTSLAYSLQHLDGDRPPALQTKIGMLWTPRTPIKSARKATPLLPLEVAHEASNGIKKKMPTGAALGGDVCLAQVVLRFDQHWIGGPLNRTGPVIKRKVPLDLLHGTPATAFKQVVALPALSRHGAAHEVAVWLGLDRARNGTAGKDGAVHGG